VPLKGRHHDTGMVSETTFVKSFCKIDQVLYVCQLSDSLNWEVGEEIPILLGSVGRKRGCFIVHHENTELLEINVCRIKLL
jgi:hypothetical protein